MVNLNLFFGLGGNVKKYVDVIHEFPTIAKIGESRTQKNYSKGSLKGFLDVISNNDYAFIDFETQGKDPKLNQPVSMACV